MKTARLIQTSKDTLDRLKVKDEIKLTTDNSNSNLILDDSITYQSIIGFGGAFTEAAAYTLSRMTKDKREEVLEKYFDPVKGLAYNIGRVHIHSCDFALENYTYVVEYDESLESFDIKRDRKWVIPMINDAMKYSGHSIPLLASPWSPPAWMKTNNDMNNGGQLLPEFRDTWAKYYTKFIDAYKREELDIWGITVQNEPAAVQIWDSCIYSEEEERDFIKNHLGPIMHESGHKDVKIVIWDHNRDVIVERASAVLSDAQAGKYVWGTGVHWYVSEEFENLSKVHDLFPDKHLIFTEGCQEGGVHLGKWHTGERYGRNIIGDLNNWNRGFIDWNLVLDETGGPNHVGNLCDAPIIADTGTNELHYNSSYYYIGHFSKYIPKGSVRIKIKSKDDEIKTFAAKTPNKEIVIVAMNETSNPKSLDFKYNDLLGKVELPSHSISTIII